MQVDKSIIIVEDETDLAELVRYNLENEGYTCRCAFDGKEALRIIETSEPQLIVLDRMLPKMSGDELIAHLKRDHRFASIPIIMLTAKVDESDELVGFALGADDYITKPFSMKLLIARVNAVFRRMDSMEEESTVLTAGPITLDINRFELLVEGQSINVTATEFRLLQALMAANGRVLSRTHLIDKVMGTSVAVTDRTIDVHITSLRKKIGDASSWLQTIRGIGYTFRRPDE